MPTSKKMDSLSQGVFRRLHNTKHEIAWEVKAKTLEKYMVELKSSGYSEKDRFEILQSGINRYDKLRKMADDGKRPFYRNRNYEGKESWNPVGCWQLQRHTRTFLPFRGRLHLTSLRRKEVPCAVGLANI